MFLLFDIGILSILYGYLFEVLFIFEVPEYKIKEVD